MRAFIANLSGRAAGQTRRSERRSFLVLIVLSVGIWALSTLALNGPSSLPLP